MTRSGAMRPGVTRLVHLTDLHFGLHREELVVPLHDAVRAARPDVVAVSGDLTQRALGSQFARAMGFVRGLGAPFLMVPGNHDLPVFNPVARLVNPFGPYRTGADRDLTPGLRVGPLQLWGANTALPIGWRRGIARPDEIDRICREASAKTTGVTRILVCHHPLLEPPGFERGETKGAGPALAALNRAGVRVVLSGHLHHWTAGLGITDLTPQPVFHMQTGTALCARVGETNLGFAVMDFDGDRLSVGQWIAEEAAPRYELRSEAVFVDRDGAWHRQA